MSNLVLDPKILNQPEEKLWVRYIKKRIKENKNFLGFISGPTGSGKSWSSISIAEQLDSEFNEERIVFSGLELMNLINSNKLKKGSCIVFEEAGIGLSNKNWQSTINKMLNFLVQTFRHRNFILIFNSPFMDFVDASTRKLFHAEFTTAGINFENKSVRLKPRTIQYNARQQKFYYKMLRVITSKGIIPVSTWNVEKPSKDLIAKYEIKKRAFTDELNHKIQEELEDYENTGTKGGESMGQSQRDVLNLLQEGLNCSDIVKESGLSLSSVHTHIRALRKKGYNIRAIREPETHFIINYVVETPELLKNRKNNNESDTLANNSTSLEVSK